MKCDLIIRKFDIVCRHCKAAIEMAGYDWFLTNVVNNGNGGWPFALGSDHFHEENFDAAQVAGDIFSEDK